MGHPRTEAAGGIQVCTGAARRTQWIGTGNGPGAIAIGPKDVWVTNQASRSVVRLDPHSFNLTAVLGLKGVPVAIAAYEETAWAICSNGWLWRVSASETSVEGMARLGSGSQGIAATGDSIWVLKTNGRLVRLDPATAEVVAETSMPRLSRRMAAGHGALWITCRRGRTLVRVDAGSGEITAEIPSPRRAVSIGIGKRSLLLGCKPTLPRRVGWLYELDPTSGDLRAVNRLPGWPRALCQDLAGAWIACATPGRQCRILRIDLHGTQTDWHETIWTVSDLAVVGDSLLLAMSTSTYALAGSGSS